MAYNSFLLSYALGQTSMHTYKWNLTQYSLVMAVIAFLFVNILGVVMDSRIRVYCLLHSSKCCVIAD